MGISLEKKGELKDANETEIKVACAKKCLKVCRGRWMPAKQYAAVGSVTGCSYYIF